MLTAERVRELFLYSDLTGQFVRRHCVRGAKKIAGSISPEGYITLHFDGKNHKAHRIAWLYTHGTLPDVLDHINGNRSDNRLANLRVATNALNTQNIRGPYKNNRNSGLLGVYKHDRGKWQARIQINGKAKSLGLFDDKYEAHAAYLSAKKQLHPFQTLA